uniref:Uncharacterized protein n=1 Tax=Arundo donax TaxID=35708 RepID=A0A0A9A6T5_ARUDO
MSLGPGNGSAAQANKTRQGGSSLWLKNARRV